MDLVLTATIGDSVEAQMITMKSTVREAAQVKAAVRMRQPGRDLRKWQMRQSGVDLDLVIVAAIRMKKNELGLMELLVFVLQHADKPVFYVLFKSTQ